MQRQDYIIFREVQRPRQIWVWILIIGIAALIWCGFIQQIIFDTLFGNKPVSDGVLSVLWQLFWIAFPILMLGVLDWSLKLRNQIVVVGTRHLDELLKALDATKKV